MKELFHLEFLENNYLLLVVFLIFGILTSASILFYVIEKIKPNVDLEELKARAKSWWFISIVFILAMVVNTKISYIAIAFLSFAAFRELYSLLGFRNSDRRAIFWAIISIPIQYYLAFIGWYHAFIIFIPVVMFLLLPLRIILKGDTNGTVKSISLLQWSLMLTVFGISHMAYLLSLPEIEGFSPGGRGLLLFLICLTEINDVMQYVWGKLLGKHKIRPKLSNKTWEGFLGGLISTTVIGCFLGSLTPLPTKELLFVSFMVALSGFIGDVVVSSVKKDIRTKNTDSFQGKVGILDRIDSIAYTAPVFFHIVFYLAY